MNGDEVTCPRPAGLELLTPAEMGHADRLTMRVIPSSTLMENAGRAVARAAIRRYGACRTLVLCGPGGNGGDGYVTARLLAARGWPVATAAWGTPRPGSDAALMAARWKGPRVAFDPAEAVRVDLVIDALFGAGLARPIEDPVADMLARARTVLAVDVPSGLDGQTGQARGRVRRADATVTFFRRKPGHLVGEGRALCGALECADIGLPEAVLDALPSPVSTWHNAPGLWHLRTASDTDHKYARGTVSVCAGAGMHGAARLAAGAARRAGAGLVRIAALAGGAPFAGGDAGVIVDEGPLDAMLADRRRLVWVCGPGLSPDEATSCLDILLRAPGLAVVADAGALSANAGKPAALRGAAVLTPHAHEFALVFGAPGLDPVGAVRAAAAAVGAVVVLKGAATIIAGPDGRVAINDHATPALATAGTGDVLAGIVGAMLAQGLEPFEAASGAVWLHGEAGIRAGAGLIAEDLADRLPAALSQARHVVCGRVAGPRTLG